MPQRVAVALITWPRRAGGEMYEMHHRVVADDARGESHDVPVVSPALAIRQALEWGVGGDKVEQAIRRAHTREHIGQRTAAARLLVALDNRGVMRSRTALAVRSGVEQPFRYVHGLMIHGPIGDHGL